MGMLRRLWWGGYPLPNAFWGFYVVGSLLCCAVAGAVSGMFIVFHARPLGVLASTIIIGGYEIAAPVGVWRSADRYEGVAWWAAFAKAVVIVMSACLIWILVTGWGRSILDQIVASDHR